MIRFESDDSFISSILLLAIFQFFDSFLAHDNSSFIYDCHLYFISFKQISLMYVFD